MAVEIRKTITVPVSVETAFEYINDYTHVPEWLFAVKKFVPTTSQTSGLGAVFDAEMHLGVTLHSTIKCIDWKENELIAMDSIKGFKNTTYWNFSADGENSSKIEAFVTYSLPFGPAGKALGKVIEPFIKITIEKTTENVHKHLS